MKRVNGIPILGFGTWQITGRTCQQAVQIALEIGYRHIDTADAYDNHRAVGEGIKQSGIKRKDIFLTSKVWRDKLHYKNVLTSAQRFLQELQTDYLDLLLVHWPNKKIPLEETFAALEELKQTGIIRNLGVSNFTIAHLDEALRLNKNIVNLQIEFHPSLYQKDLKAYCDQHGIAATAYSPLAQGKDFQLPVIQELTKKYNRPPSQIILNWIISKNVIAIPRSAKRKNIEDNFNVFEWQLDSEDTAQIDSLNLRRRMINPHFSEFSD